MELGSRDLNGNAWDLFENCEMTGVDWESGKNVTHVMKCHETKFKKESFDVLVTINHLEHDPYWEKSLQHNYPALKKGGLFILRWASTGSSEHSIEHDPSGEDGYYPKSLNDIIHFLKKKLDVEVLEEGQKSNDYIGLMAWVIAKKKKDEN